MKIKVPFRLAGILYFTLFIFSMFMLSGNTAYADYAEDLKIKTDEFATIPEEKNSSPVMQPFSKVTFRGLYYSNYEGRPYCFENSEGRCLDKEYNLFSTLEGKGHFEDTFYVYYKTELNEDDRFRLKKAYGLLRTGIWSWEAGKDTVRLGPGYHGALLLSNNAEGFWLVRIRAEEPFRLPWLLSYLGDFKYDLFHGWLDKSNILGQRLSLRPIPLLELGANQIVYYDKGRHFKIYEYPKVFFSSSENSGDRADNRYDNDQKVSLDVALDMPFLAKIPPLVNGKLYAEYGGNDSFAAWQKEDTAVMRTMWQEQNTKWIWPIGFDVLNIGWLAGLFLTTGNVDLRFEYAQDYASYPLFYDLYGKYGWDRRHGPFYYDFNSQAGINTGHHMGNDADDLFVEVTIRRHPASLKLFYDKERHGLSRDATFPPEERYQYGLMPSYQFKTVTLFAEFIYNQYRNANFSNEPLLFDIHPGVRRDEFIAGLGAEFNF